MKSHEGRRAGAVYGQGRPSEVEDVGDSVGRDTHGKTGAGPVVDHTRVHVCGICLIISVHKPCNKTNINTGQSARMDIIKRVDGNITQNYDLKKQVAGNMYQKTLPSWSHWPSP